MISVKQATIEQMEKIRANIDTMYASSEYTKDDIIDIVIDNVINNYDFDKMMDDSTLADGIRAFADEAFDKAFKKSV